MKGDGKGLTLMFKKEKDTKNTVKFQEVEREGKPPVIGTLYVQKWAVGGRDEVTITLDWMEG